jgi:hypothetical protein
LPCDLLRSSCVEKTGCFTPRLLGFTRSLDLAEERTQVTECPRFILTVGHGIISRQSPVKVQRVPVKRIVKGPIMNDRGFVAVSMRELERIKIIAALAEHRLKVVQAAERLERIVAWTESRRKATTPELPIRHGIKPVLLVGEPVHQHIEEQPDLGA